jgi:hypothetical protein
MVSTKAISRSVTDVAGGPPHQFAPQLIGGIDPALVFLLVVVGHGAEDRGQLPLAPRSPIYQIFQAWNCR